MATLLSWVAVISAVFTSAAWAAPCAPETVAGTWSLVSIRAAEPGVEEFYALAPYEWTRYTIEDDRVGMVYVASNRPKGSPAEIEVSLDRAGQTAGVDYTVRWLRPGRMLVLRAGEPFQAFECSILEAPAADALVGDMVITQIEGRPMLRRVQRRIAP